MSEVVNVLVAFAVIVFIFRWATSGPSTSSSSAAAALGFRPKSVTQEMVDQIHTMFPDIPTDNIRFDLLRTGSVEITSNKILERGFLEPPSPAYFTLYPRLEGENNGSRRSASRQNPTPTSAATTTARPASLIDRYNLAQKITDSSASDQSLVDIGGKAKWEDTPEKREASLRERKAQMVLAARQRMLAQRQKEGLSGSS